jgi:hypothetical protein
MKSNILTLEATLSHTLTFNELKRYIEKSKPEFMPFLNLYCLIKLYCQNLKMIFVKTNQIKSYCKDLGQHFNPKDSGNPELQLMQIMLGKSMITILDYIS